MIDDLDLAWEEQGDPRPRRRSGPPSRQTRARRRRERKRQRRSFGALLISIIMLAALGVGVYVGVGAIQDFLAAPDFPATGTEEVTIEVKRGDTVTDIGNTLYGAGVVKSAMAFIKVAEDDPRGKTIQVGFYHLVKPMRAVDALAMLLDPEKNLVVNRVTIPEGAISIDIYTKLSQATGIPVAEFTKAAANPKALLGDYADIWFTRGDGKPVATNIEGFLFPDTYAFPPNLTAEQILQRMIARFMNVAEKLDFTNNVSANLHISPYEALIAASIAQSEARLAEDFPKVSRVLYNRAYGDFPCNCLGVDVAVNYWLRMQGKEGKASENLTYAQLHDTKNPYNTHDKAGMPRGPISNPGEEALTGAMNPAGGNMTFFVTIDKDGHMAYASSNAGHEKNIQLACKNGIPLC